MLRSGTCVPVFVIFTFIGFVTAEYTISNNGWVPVSSEKIYNQVRREFEHTSNYHSSDNRDVTISGLEQGAEINDEYVIDKDEYLNKLNKLHPVKFSHSTRGDNQDVIYNKESIRKSKKMTENVDKKEVNDNVIKYEEVPVEVVTNNQILRRAETGNDGTEKLLKLNLNVIAKDSTNTYEVTEESKVEYVQDPNDLKGNVEHYYNTPAIQNLTSKFFDILSKYNIKANDELQNYELSRRDKAEISMKQYYRMPLLIPYRYNSPNHVPIDPLFAVLLSNYGVYLPGMYGINSNYDNLYGYLASNNIHNNKPFGLYKVYSDTDSSN